MNDEIIVKELIKPIRKSGIYEMGKDLSVINYRQETAGQVMLFKSQEDYELFRDRNGLTDADFEDVDINTGGGGDLENVAYLNKEQLFAQLQHIVGGTSGIKVSSANGTNYKPLYVNGVIETNDETLSNLITELPESADLTQYSHVFGNAGFYFKTLLDNNNSGIIGTLVTNNINTNSKLQLLFVEVEDSHTWRIDVIPSDSIFNYDPITPTSLVTRKYVDDNNNAYAKKVEYTTFSNSNKQLLVPYKTLLNNGVKPGTSCFLKIHTNNQEVMLNVLVPHLTTSGLYDGPVYYFLYNVSGNDQVFLKVENFNNQNVSFELDTLENDVFTKIVMYKN